MKIEKINIKNFKGIRSYEGDIQGKNVYLIGANASGKSSFIDAVWFGLTGKNCPPTPITDDGKRGVIEIDLGDFIARTKLKKGRPVEFELENKNFTEESEKFIKAPRTFMEKKLGILNFDINEFFNKTDAEKVKYFSKIMNEDFSDIDNEIEEITESRKFDKRKLAELGAKDTYYDEETASKEFVSVVELSRQIDFEKEKERNYNRISEGIKERKSKASEIRAKIAELEKGLEQVDGEVIDGEKWLEIEENKPKIEYIAELQKEIENSETINAKIREAKEAKKADDAAEQLKSAIQTANDEIESLKTQKAERISSRIKIDGLEYSTAEERFLWNGLPFDPKQTNTAAQLIAGMKIGSTLLKELKILKIDASLIDKINFNKVLEWADNEKIELFVELVDREATNLQIHVDEN